MVKKKTKKQAPAQLSPEQYVRKKARGLKIKACYITDDYETTGLGQIVVAREHINGKVTLGSYLVDKFCLGVKNTFYKFSMSEYEYDEFVSRVCSHGAKEISYEEAHNRIFGAVEFAEEAGIEPHKNFKLTQYILEEDDDRVPLIEYEYGKDGKHYLIAKNNLEASRYLPLLRKNLGDDFKWVILADPYSTTCDYEGYDEYNDDKAEDFFLKNLKDSPLFKIYGPETVYTYKHPEYPSSVELENPIVEDILCDPKNALYLKPEQIDTLLALPHDSLRRDLENLILYHIGIGCDGIPQEVLDADFNGVIGSAVMLLAEVGNSGSSLDVVLEVMRQSEEFSDYHISDSGEGLFVPTLYKLGQNQLDKLMAFMKEEGLRSYDKSYVSAAVSFIAQQHAERRSEVIEWFRELVSFATEKLPETQFVDSTLAGFIADNLMDLKAKELLPEIKAMFDTGLVELGICGKYDDVVKEITDKEKPYFKEHITDIYKRFEDMRRQFG